MRDQRLVFFAGTILITLFSWFVSIREGRYHGIPRFFAFEGLLALGLLNSPVWFKDPLSIPQIVSWLLFIFSICYAIIAFSLFRRYGKHGRNFENTTRLVTTGLYHFVRHPMYGSLLFLGWGMFLKSITLHSIVLLIMITLALYTTGKIEEEEVMKKFGEDYSSYLKKTKMWIPKVI